jgi:hypothetical protein
MVFLHISAHRGCIINHLNFVVDQTLLLPFEQRCFIDKVVRLLLCLQVSRHLPHFLKSFQLWQMLFNELLLRCLRRSHLMPSELVFDIDLLSELRGHQRHVHRIELLVLAEHCGKLFHSLWCLADFFIGRKVTTAKIWTDTSIVLLSWVLCSQGVLVSNPVDVAMDELVPHFTFTDGLLLQVMNCQRASLGRLGWDNSPNLTCLAVVHS